MISVVLVLFVALLRILPHAANFAPMGAVAIFAGRHLPRHRAIFVTILALLLSDALLSRLYGYPIFGFVSLFVYAGFLLQAFLGRMLRNQSYGSLTAAVSGAFVFFLLSNFGVWLEGTMYPLTLSGLGTCYVMAIPFLKFTLIGNLVWTPILNFAYKAYLTRRESQPLPVS
jgi:hypothetical protein